MTDIQFYEILFGVLLLLLGKRLFWLFVGIVGFIAGMELAPKFFPGYSEFLVFVLALTLGLMGAAMAMVFQWAAIITAGFLGGGYLFFYFFPMNSLTAFLIGGIIGSLLLAIVFDWTLIILSSLAGVMLISRNLSMPDTIRVFTIIALAVFGIIIQSAIFLKKQGPK